MEKLWSFKVVGIYLAGKDAIMASCIMGNVGGLGAHLMWFGLELQTFQFSPNQNIRCKGSSDHGPDRGIEICSLFTESRAEQVTVGSLPFYIQAGALEKLMRGQ